MNIVKVRLPKISANVEEATVTSWLKPEGATVTKDDNIAELTTDKGVVEFQAPDSGTLLRHVVPESSTVPTGFIIALIGDLNADLPEVESENRRIMEAHRREMDGADNIQTRRVRKARRQRVRATPAARRLARRHKLDLQVIKDSLGVELVDEAAIQQYMEDRKV